MKEPDIIRFRENFPHFWTEVLKALPEGHVNLLASLFYQCDQLTAQVWLHFVRDEDGGFTAFATPRQRFQHWDAGVAMALIVALDIFNHRQAEICAVCGLPGARHCISPEFCGEQAHVIH